MRSARQVRNAIVVFAALAAGASVPGCGVDTVPEGLRRTPPGDGPRVRFDLVQRPLPEIPLPNDVATFPDPTSRTGRRVDVSLIAPTQMERRAREGFASMEGWGTSAPISVSFERSAATDPRRPAIDLDDVADRMQGDEHDLSDDPVYLVNLVTGVPVFLDAGTGYYPVTLRDPFRYFPNDPKAEESNLSFETVEEGAGLAQRDYRPELDLDFDGVLDHPNVLGQRGIAGIDNLLTWYERETDTLLFRPIVPLDEKTPYAVVLTDRLRGDDRKPVRSPFEAIHHPAQRGAVARLREILEDGRFASYYGDIAGTGLEHVAFTWTFTTQPTHEDMRVLRDGLYGKGPFRRFAEAFPPELEARKVAGLAPFGEDERPAWATENDACRARAKTPYAVKVNEPDVKASFRQFFEQVFRFSPGQLAAMDEGFQHIDHVVVGTFSSPFLLGDPQAADPSARFRVDFRSGDGDVRPADVSWFLIVPRAGGALQQPFPVAFWGHGVTGSAAEALVYGGDYARQGIALFGYDQPEHGLVFGDGERLLAHAMLTPNCLVPFPGAFANGRARDGDGDGKPDSGISFWSSQIFHTRDNLRQGILDGMQAVRILRSFDGRVGPHDYTGDGLPDVAGDFDGDGVPDVGGPGVAYFASGESLGGIVSSIQGGIEPHMIAAAPMSGGGVLAMDVAMRSYGVVDSVMGQMMGPLVIAVPASERPDDGRRERMGTRCAAAQRSLRVVVNDGLRSGELEIACLNGEELDARMTVVVTNVTSGEARCARTGEGGRFRVPVPTSAGDRLDVQIYGAPDVVRSYDGCAVLPDAPVGRRVSTWEQAALVSLPVADSDVTRCDAEEGCQQFRDRFFPVGSDLVAPNEGLGLRRQSPALRRFRDLGQAAMDPADPVNYAPYYLLKPLFDEAGERAAPHALLTVNTVGDNFVPVAAGITFARAAGAVPFLPPSALARYPHYADYVTPQELYDRLGRRTPMQFLVDTHVVEGVARLGRTRAGPACRANYRADDALCTDAPDIAQETCDHALFDPDWTSEGRLPFDQPHATTPLRLGRTAGVVVRDSTSLAAAWEPRLRGVPFAPDETAWSATGPVLALLHQYVAPGGAHTWGATDRCLAWDPGAYGNALMARFFASEGRDVYYLSHPKTHGCLADGLCDFFR
jgi:hypothetical protein